MCVCALPSGLVILIGGPPVLLVECAGMFVVMLSSGGAQPHSVQFTFISVCRAAQTCAGYRRVSLIRRVLN